MKPLIFWGATGQALVLHEFARERGFEVIAVLDRDAAVSPSLPDVPIFTGPDAFERWSERRPAGDVWFVIAVGGDGGRDRLAIGAGLAARGLCAATLVHPTAFVAGSARLGGGSVVLAQATVGAGARLGEACIVNTRASVDHQCVLGAGVHIGPGATLAGCVDVGTCSFIATGAVVAPRIVIGPDTVIGAGSVVVSDVPGGVVAFGNPARVRRSR